MDSTGVLYVKNMVCPRCIASVAAAFAQLEIPVKAVHLGEVWLSTPLTRVQQTQLVQDLEHLGFELLVDASFILVEQMKRKILEYVQAERAVTVNLSDYVAAVAPLSYARLARLFVLHTSLTIEKYYILQRIEKAKELLSYGELSLEEVALHLHYKDGSHLSKQFKKVVGVTPTQYRKSQTVERKFLDHIIT